MAFPAAEPEASFVIETAQIAHAMAIAPCDGIENFRQLIGGLPVKIRLRDHRPMRNDFADFAQLHFQTVRPHVDRFVGDRHDVEIDPLIGDSNADTTARIGACAGFGSRIVRLSMDASGMASVAP